MLGEKDYQVLILRFGLDGGEKHTLEQVGKMFNVTRERIRQREARALHKLRTDKTMQALWETEDALTDNSPVTREVHPNY